MVRVEVNHEALEELARQLVGLRAELDAQGERIEDYAPALGHQAVIERLLDFTANWSKAKATVAAELAELAALARGCAAAYRDQEAALARCIAAADAPVIGPPVLAAPPLLVDLGPVVGAGPSVLRLPEPPPSIRISYPWSPLAEENPVRGDPWAVLDLARYLGERAAVIADIARALERIQTGEVWEGTAGDAFRERRSEAIPRLRQIEARDEHTQRALNRYAPNLEAALDRADLARRGAEAAQGLIAEAQRGLEREAEQRDAALRSGAPPPVAMIVDWQARLDDAYGAVIAARRILDEAVADWDGAAGACARAIGAAVDDDLTDPKRKPWERIAAAVLDRFPAIKDVAAWAGKASGVLGIAAALTAAIPVLGQVIGAAALVVTGISLLANTTLWLGGEGSILPVVLDVINIATLGTARAATAAARGSVGATAARQMGRMRGLAGRALVRQGGVLPTAQGFRVVTAGGRRRVVRELGELAGRLGVDDATTFMPSVKSWGQALPLWRRIELPARELLEISPNALRQAGIARGAGRVGVLLDVEDTGALDPLKHELGEGIEALRRRGGKP